MLRKPAAPHYVTSSTVGKCRDFFCSRRYSHPRARYLLIMTLLCISFRLPSEGLKLLSRHETNLRTPPMRNSRVTAFLFRGRISRYRKKSECLKLCCGAVIAVSPDGRWSWKGLPHLSPLDVLCWKCGIIFFQLKWPLPAPLSSVSSMFLSNSSWQIDGLFLSFELPWVFLTCRKSLMMHRLYYSLKQNWAFSRSSWEIQKRRDISCFL